MTSTTLARVASIIAATSQHVKGPVEQLGGCVLETRTNLLYLLIFFKSLQCLLVMFTSRSGGRLSHEGLAQSETTFS